EALGRVVARNSAGGVVERGDGWRRPPGHLPPLWRSFQSPGVAGRGAHTRVICTHAQPGKRAEWCPVEPVRARSRRIVGGAGVAAGRRPCVDGGGQYRSRGRGFAWGARWFGGGVLGRRGGRGGEGVASRGRTAAGSWRWALSTWARSVSVFSVQTLHRPRTRSSASSICSRAACRSPPR